MLATTALVFFQFVWNPQRLVLEEHAFRYQVCADIAEHVSVFDPTDWLCHYVKDEVFEVLPHEHYHDRCDSVSATGECNAPRTEERHETF